MSKEVNLYDSHAKLMVLVDIGVLLSVRKASNNPKEGKGSEGKHQVVVEKRAKENLFLTEV